MQVRQIIGPLKAKPSGCAFVLVSATMTKQVAALVAAEFPGIRRVQTASLHRGVVGARHNFTPLPPGMNKLELMLGVRFRGAVRREQGTCCPWLLHELAFIVPVLSTLQSAWGLRCVLATGEKQF